MSCHVDVRFPSFAAVCRGGPARACMRSPGRPKTLSTSAGSSPVLPNQGSSDVLNSASSPTPRTVFFESDFVRLTGLRSIHARSVRVATPSASGTDELEELLRHFLHA